MVARQEAEQLGEPPRQAVRSYRAPPPASPLPVPGAERDGCTGRARPTSIHQLNPSKRGSICIWDLSPTLAISSVPRAEPHCAQPPLSAPRKARLRNWIQLGSVRTTRVSKTTSVKAAAQILN